MDDLDLSVSTDPHSQSQQDPFEIQTDHGKISSRDMNLHLHYTSVLQTPSLSNLKALSKELDYRIKIEQILNDAFPDQMDALRNGQAT